MEYLTICGLGLALALNAAACGGTTTGSGGGGGTTATTTSDAGTKAPTCLHLDHQCGKGVKGVCYECTCGGEGCVNPGNVICTCDGALVPQPSGCNAFEYSKDASACSKGTFPCGATQCKDYIEYCISGGPGAGCAPVPDICDLGIVDCNCATHYKAEAGCTNDGHGGVTVLCGPPGGVCSDTVPCCDGTSCDLTGHCK
jgi:hypothetical protein